MHSDIRVVKQALQQLEKAKSWVDPALEIESFDQELVEQWIQLYSEMVSAMRDFLENER